MGSSKRVPLDDIVDEDGPGRGAKRDDDIVDEDVNPDDKLPSHAIQHKDGSVTLPLAWPQTIVSRKDGKVRERKFEELTFFRLTGADHRAIANASQENMSIVAFARSTRINEAVMGRLFDKMDAADITDGGRVLNHFLTSGRKIGK